jgi:hypothetical protein
MKRSLVAVALMLFSHAAFSVALFGTVDALSGRAFVVDPSGSKAALVVGQQLFEGQTINTAQDGELHVATEDAGFVALRPNTTFRVDEYAAEGDAADKVFMSLLKGSMRSITGWIGKHNPQSYRINTPTATIGVRGTDHETTVVEESDGDEAGTYDTVNEGRTVISNAQGTTEVTPGTHAFAPRFRAIAPMVLAKRPGFWLKRKLLIEDRISARKTFLIHRIENLRDERRKARQQYAPDRSELKASRLARQEIRREKWQERHENGAGEEKPGLEKKREKLEERRAKGHRHPDE